MKLNYLPELKRKFSTTSRNSWEYALKCFKGKNVHPLALIFDTCVDRSFLEEKIPAYESNWVGVIHNAPGQYNLGCNILFTVGAFIKSLKECKGIFVFSNYTKEWLDNREEIKQAGITVSVLYLPTDTPKFTFDINRFQSNPNKKLVQIGSWLRDTSALEQLGNLVFLQKNILGTTTTASQAMTSLPPHAQQQTRPQIKGRSAPPPRMPLGKVTTTAMVLAKTGNKTTAEELKSKSMAKITMSSGKTTLKPPANATRVVKTILPKQMKQPDLSTKQVETPKPNVLKQVSDSKLKVSQPIHTLKFVNNYDYDKLLSQNIVFIKLITISGCNVVCECIVRNTPLLVNKLPAVIEYLGVDYPFYYDTLEEATEKANSVSLITATSDYLKKWNMKNNLTQKAFYNSLINSKVYLEL